MNEMAYIGRAKCGCIVAVTCDTETNTLVADDVAEFIRSGLTIEHMDIETFRNGCFGHAQTCKERKEGDEN